MLLDLIQPGTVNKSHKKVTGAVACDVPASNDDAVDLSVRILRAAFNADAQGLYYIWRVSWGDGFHAREFW